MRNKWSTPEITDNTAAELQRAAQQLMQLFPCSQRSFATWDPNTLEPNDKGKLVPKYITERRPITVNDWAEHLAGRRAVVVPLRCDDDTTQVTLLDVDRYDVDLAALLKKIKLMGLPLHVSRSKSGGPHVTAFHDARIAVADSERLAKELIRRLRLSGPVEIFPRPQRPGVLAHDTNMPYFGGKRGHLRPDSDASDEMLVFEFLNTVTRMTAEQRNGLLATAPPSDAGGGEAYAEMMLARYSQQITAEALGGRNGLINKVAFHLATMAARGWIEEGRVEEELIAAADAAEWDNRRKTLSTIRGAIKAGLKEPHEDLDKHYVANVVAIMNINADHALVLAGDKAAVLNEMSSSEFRLLTVAAFNQWLANRFVTVLDKEGADKRVPLAKFWLGHSQRRQYNDIVFSPDHEVPGTYNLWRGFAVKPQKGDCSKFLGHLHDNICQGNDQLFRWVEAWWADIVQHPASKCGTSLVARGKQGTGKTKVSEYMQATIGSAHFIKVADPRYITGRFNSHLASCLVLHADEGFWAGDRSAEGKLKDLITGNDHFLELKGKEAFRVNNFVRLFVTGNHDWQIPAAFEERRMAVLDVGEEHREDYSYFAAIDHEMKNGGPEALLHHLLQVDCSAVNLRQIPNTTALLEQKIASMTTEQAWWLDILRNGTLPNDYDGAGVSPSKEMYEHYLAYAKSRGTQFRKSETALGMFLYKYVPQLLREHRPYKDGKILPRIREFPPLAECRDTFAQLLQAQGMTADLGWDSTEEWEATPGLPYE